MQIFGRIIQKHNFTGVHLGPSQLEKTNEFGFNERKVLIRSLAPNGVTWAGLYPSEIASVTMLGDGKELKWEMTKEGLIIETPRTKPCDYAFVFKIVRKKPF